MTAPDQPGREPPGREPPKREPPAEMRTMAAALRNMHVALLDEGFSTAEALAIIGYAISGAVGARRDGT